jgi:cell wall-associated NlpC family hydrolase
VTRNIVRVLTATLVATSLSLASVVPLTKSTSSAEAAVAKATPKRISAMKWARGQKGKPYCYGGNGPRCFDCSGLVKKAYGKYLGNARTAQQIWASSKTKTIPRSKARWGDLVFWFSSGRATHVELLAGKKLNYRFGASRSGTRIGYRKLYGSPRFAHVVGAG